MAQEAQEAIAAVSDLSVVPMLTDDQRLPLQMAFGEFLRLGRWPLWGYVDSELFERGVDPASAMRVLPRRLYHPDRRGLGGFRIEENEELSLTIRGVACCHGSERVVARFLRALRWAVEERRKARPRSPDEVVDPVWRYADFVGGVRLDDEEHVGLPAHEVRLVLRLMEHEWGTISWAGPPEDPISWSIKIARQVRRFATVESLPDYLFIAYPSEGQVDVPPANPFVFPVVESQFPLMETPEDESEDLASLHEDIRSAAVRLFSDGHYDHAVFDAFKAVNNRIKRMTGVAADGYSLMAKTLNPEHPVVRFNDLKSQSEQDEQRGLMHIFMGAMSALRNPRAHEDDLSTSREEALEHLGLASLLMRKLDAAVVTREDGAKEQP